MRRDCQVKDDRIVAPQVWLCRSGARDRVSCPHVFAPDLLAASRAGRPCGMGVADAHLQRARPRRVRIVGDGGDPAGAAREEGARPVQRRYTIDDANRLDARHHLGSCSGSGSDSLGV